MRLTALTCSLLLLSSAPALAQVEIVPTETAIQPPPPPPRKGSPLTVAYDGGTVFRTDDETFELKLTGRMQTRYELFKVLGEDEDGESPELVQRFVLPRTRIGMDGYVFSRDIRFKMEGSFSDNGNPRLRDFYFDVGLAGGQVIFRAGQFKRPYNRQELVSDFGTEMPEKAATNEFARGSRDIGLMVHNGIERSPDGLEWALAFVNGQGDRAVPRCTQAGGSITCSPPSNVPSDFQPQLVARLGFNVGGIRGYSEADLEGGPLRLAAAVSYKLMNIEDDDLRGHGLQADLVIKAHGLSFQAAGFMEKLGDADTQFAGHAQAGVFLTPKQHQLVGRFGATPLPVTATGDQDYVLEIRGGFNWYFFGHSLKWSNDIGIVKATTEGADAELQARLQAQIVF
jgi:hypothetical protein